MRSVLIRTKLKEIEESIRLVEAHLPATFGEFYQLGLVKDGMYKQLEFALENIFDICAIINADLELGIPRTDEDVIEHLVKGDVLSEEQRTKLKSMKGFRNILVHRYGKIDDKLTFSLLNDELRDVYDFIRRIRAFLETEEWRL
ncbi:MAG: type VII toxin-antitoxin system HepT family RNase toxin [Candidatus Methanospirareceae archaeon]